MTDTPETPPEAAAPAPPLPAAGSTAQITAETLELALGIVVEGVRWAPPLRSDDVSPADQIARRGDAMAIVEVLARKGFAAAQDEAKKAARADDLASRRKARAARSAAKRAKPVKKATKKATP